jgi:hypothetical protein
MRMGLISLSRLMRRLVLPAPGGMPLCTRALPRTSVRAKARRTLADAALILTALVAGIWTSAEVVRPEVGDPDYLARRDLLRERLKERPHDRLAIVLGSSRTGLGFVPESLPQHDGTLWFNLSHFGSGPVFLLATLDRLERDGIRPDLAIIELMPPFLVEESARLVGTHLSLGEVIASAEYGDGGLRGWYFLRHRLILGNLKQALDPLGTIEMPKPYGGPPLLYDAMEPARREALSQIEREKYGRCTRAMEVSPTADRALRDLLARCHERGIKPVLLLAPEAPSFRAVYGPDGSTRLDRYLASITAEHRVRLIDARDWLDEDDFFDSHHPIRRGAEEFTRRLTEQLRQ